MFYDRILASFMTMAFVGAYFGISIPVLMLALGGLFILGYGANRYFLYQSQTVQIFKGQIQEILSSVTFWLALLTLTSFGVSSYFGVRPDKSIHDWTSVCAIAFAGMVWGWGLRYTSHKFFDLLAQYMLIGVCIISACFIAEVVAWKFFGFLVQNEWRLFTLRKVSVIGAILAPFALFYTLKTRSLIGLCGLGLITFASFLCGGRTGNLAFLLTVFVFFFVFPWEQMGCSLKDAARVAFVLMVNIFLGFKGYIWIAGETTAVDRYTGTSMMTGAGRTDIWENVIRYIQDVPYLGVGIGGFSYLSFPGATLNTKSHPHNMVLEIILETGGIGFVLILSLGIIMTYSVFLSFFTKSKTGLISLIELKMLMLSLFAYGVAAQFLTSFFHGWWLTYPVMLLAVVFALRIKQQEERTLF